MYVSLHLPVLFCFDYHTFVVGFEIGECESSSFVFFFQDCFGCYEGDWEHFAHLYSCFSL